MHKKELGGLQGFIRSMGAVFGDIGTSPLYTLSVILLLTRPKGEEIIGVVSLIVWTLIILVTLQYAWFAMNLSLKGEGGTIVLGEIASSIVKGKRLRKVFRFLVFLGVGFLLGDGVITPAITILSSAEGIRLIEGLENLPQHDVILIAILITLALFFLQPKGTGKIGAYFGPVMLVWFSSIGLMGLYHVWSYPRILMALSPLPAVEFVLEDPLRGLVVLSEVILAATGGEAMYADMGHLGRVAIRHAWAFVFPMLTLNYLGQGAYAILNPAKVQKDPVFFASAKDLLGEVLYLPFLLLVIMAGIIASQALISGVFSIVFQGINTRIMPMLRVKHTSTEISTQIYIPAANWLLFVGVLLMYLIFRTSDNMAHAYGFAVNTVMVITALFLAFIYFLRRSYFYFLGSLFLLSVDLLFFISSLYKVPHGGYWSVIFALVPISIILLYTSGQKRLYQNMKFMPFKDFVLEFEKVYKESPHIKGTAVFLVRDVKSIPQYVWQTMFEHGIVYENNIFLSLIKREEPFGVESLYKGSIANGLGLAEIRFGYMEVLDIKGELKRLNLEERVIFYGMEQVYTEKPIWKAFALLKRITPSFTEFYRFPTDKLHGITVRVSF